MPLSTGKFFFFNFQAKIMEKLSSPDSNISLWKKKKQMPWVNEFLHISVENIKMYLIMFLIHHVKWPLKGAI